MAARGGVIIKNADIIHRGFKVTDMVFGKTGNLTEPSLEVVQELIFPTDIADQDAMLSIIMTMVRSNKHPVSKASGQSVSSLGMTTKPEQELGPRVTQDSSSTEITTAPEESPQVLELFQNLPKCMQVYHYPLNRRRRAIIATIRIRHSLIQPSIPDDSRSSRS